MSNVKGKRVAVLVEKFYEDLELWYPVLRLREAGCDVKIVGPKAGETYASKHGYPAKSDVAAGEVKAADFDAVIIPGGYSPDHMRRHPADGRPGHPGRQQGKVLAAICHGPWMLCSAKCLKGRKVTGFFAIRDDVENAGGIWEDAACVRDGNLVTSRTPDDLPAFMQGILAALEEAVVSYEILSARKPVGFASRGTHPGRTLHGESYHGQLTPDQMNSLIRFSSISWRPLGSWRRRPWGRYRTSRSSKLGLAGFDATAELAIPAPVAFLDERGEPAVGDDGVGDLEAAGKASIPPIWAWNRSIGSKLSRRTLASKLMPPVVKPPMPQDAEHALGGQVNAGGKLVGIPAEQVIAAYWRRSIRERRRRWRPPSRASSHGRRAWHGWSRG